MRWSALVPVVSPARTARACFTDASAPPSLSAFRAAVSASARSGSPPTSQRPSPRDADGHGLEALAVDGGQHRGRAGQRDLVLARLAAEHHTHAELLRHRSTLNRPGSQRELLVVQTAVAHFFPCSPRHFLQAASRAARSFSSPRSTGR